MMKISSHLLAEVEINEAAEYYSNSRPGLGKEFLDEIDRSVAEIRINPNQFPLVSAAARKKLVNRFPFTIYFRVTNNEIRIVAIAHQSREPFYWKDRT